MGKKLTTEEFIQKAKQVHGNRYDYSLVEYKGNKSKVKIICSKHGDFLQRADHHVNGANCKMCSYTKLIANNFIEKAKTIHGDKYDYSLVEYKNNYTKVKIICQEHGVFEQQPTHHLNGSNCSACNESKGELKIARILDKNNIKYKRQYRLDNCKNIKPLPFDFYIPDTNILIEFDGEQHYKPINFFGGIKGFE